MFQYIRFSVEVKQKYLRLSIQNGDFVKDLRRSIIRWCEVGINHKLVEVDNAALFILHLELRCSENKLAHLWNEGFQHCKTKAMVDEYIESIEAIVNEGKVDQSSHQNQWTFPINKERDGVASDFFTKGRVQIEHLIKTKTTC